MSLNNKIHAGTVRWFDNRSGNGFIRVGDRPIYVHYSAIAKHLIKDHPNNKWDKSFFWRILFPGQSVQVRLIEDFHFTQISEVLK